MLKKFLFVLIFASFLWSGDKIEKDNYENELKRLKGYERLSLLLKINVLKYNFSCNRYIEMGKEIVLLASGKNDNRAKATGLQVMAIGYSCLKKNERTLELYFESRKIARKYNYSGIEARANLELGNVFYFCYNDFIRAIEYYKKSLSIYIQIKEIYGQSRIRNNIAEIFMKIGKYAKAAEFYTRALESLDKLGAPYIISRMVVLGNLSQVTIQLGNLKIARQYIDQYERILINNPNQKKQLKLYTLKSQISLKGKNYQQALDFINSAYELQKILAKDTSPLAGDRVTMSIIISRLEILLKMNKLRQVKKNFLEVERILKKTPDPFSQAKISLIRSMLYYAEGHLKKAVKVGEKNTLFCLKYNFIRELDQIYSNLSTWYSELNQSDLSLKYYRKREKVWKKNLSRDLPAEIMAIIMNYEKKKLSNEIRNLKGFNIWMIYLCVVLLF